MIFWVDSKFTRWGHWLVNNRGMGSKGLTAKLDGMPGAGGGGVCVVPMVSVECSRINDWVRTLPKDKQTLMLEVYASGRGGDANARELKMSKRTLYARLHSLQSEFMAWSTDMKNILESKNNFGK